MKMILVSLAAFLGLIGAAQAESQLEGKVLLNHSQADICEHWTKGRFRVYAEAGNAWVSVECRSGFSPEETQTISVNVPVNGLTYDSNEKTVNATFDTEVVICANVRRPGSVWQRTEPTGNCTIETEMKTERVVGEYGPVYKHHLYVRIR